MSEINYELPKVDYPKLDMPEPPKALELEGGHMSCEGEIHRDPTKVDNSFVTPPEPGVPRILIGLPILSYSHEFVDTFLRFWTQVCTQPKGKMQVGYQFMYRKPVHMAEIQLVEIAIWNKCTHILFLDDDIYDYTLDDLNKLLAADKDVISGVMYASKFPFAMCVFRRFETEKKLIDMPSDNKMYRLYEVPCSCTKCNFGLSHWDMKFCPICGEAQDNILQKTDLIPFPFTLMKVSIFDKIKKPWFHCEIEYPSDSWFADRCIEAGIQQWAHMGVRLNHAGVNDITKPHMFNMELEKRKTKEPDKSGLIGLDEKDMAKHQFFLDVKMKEAEAKLKPRPTMVGTTEGVQNDGTHESVTDGVPKEEGVKVPS